ncbi:MAG: metallophosphoesterase [Planctomycetes bacterium]|nr:metallophosphoesterase [Planctomycetota bacterium]
MPTAVQPVIRALLGPSDPVDLVRPLPQGPLDIVGDVHGEFEALNALIAHLGYDPDGDHPHGRRLVFVGDLIDRGPDSVAVVRWIHRLISAGRALAVMGNHDLNVVLGSQKADNGWILGHQPPKGDAKPVANDAEREEITTILRALPLALEREDLRVVHAAWDDAAIEALRPPAPGSTAGPGSAPATGNASGGASGDASGRGEGDIVAVYRMHAERTKAMAAAVSDPIDQKLIRQNQNPIKFITSGPEHRVAEAFEIAGKLRNEARSRWWDRYEEGPMCVFGHYSRAMVPGAVHNDGLFAGAGEFATLGPNGGKAVCIDYSVGYRFRERKAGNTAGPFIGRLAALRWPERELVFDCGQRTPLEFNQTGGRTVGTSGALPGGGGRR